MKEIKLTRGLVALVDDEDFEWLNQFKWRASNSPTELSHYAIRHVIRNGVRTTIAMHRELLGISDQKLQSDHRDRNGLNNQRSNLRVATTSLNGANRLSSKVQKSSRYRGVCWSARSRLWIAQIKYQKRVQPLGSFQLEIEAAQRYDEAARELFGDFARLNFPKEGELSASLS